MDDFKKGYEFFIKNTGGFAGADSGQQYVDQINDEIKKFQADMNQFKGFNTDHSILQGDIAEFWHSGTHNIDAAVKGKTIRTTVDRSHDFASADVVDHAGNEYGMKYYQTGTDSAKAQATSIFERYAKYKSNAINSDKPYLSLAEFMKKRGYDDVQLLNDPIYSGQVRIIPKDQLQDAIQWLERKIAKESTIRPEQVRRYEETLKMLKDKIATAEGTESIPLTRDDAEFLAQLAKKGEFDPNEHGFTTEELVKLSTNT